MVHVFEPFPYFTQTSVVLRFSSSGAPNIGVLFGFFGRKIDGEVFLVVPSTTREIHLYPKKGQLWHQKGRPFQAVWEKPKPLASGFRAEDGSRHGVVLHDDRLGPELFWSRRRGGLGIWAVP